MEAVRMFVVPILYNNVCLIYILISCAAVSLYSNNSSPHKTLNPSNIQEPLLFTPAPSKKGRLPALIDSASRNSGRHFFVWGAIKVH